jgi:putative DNA primase/helicase
LIREHHFFIAYGQGENGKGTLFETMLHILGDYADMIEMNALLNTDKSDVRGQEQTGKLRGLRLAIASESSDTKGWNSQLIKQLTGGDTLVGAKLRGDSYTFKPTHHLWIQGNHLPHNKDGSHGFWRRPVVIPFKADFSVSKDLKFPEKLLAECEGIFTWLVHGAIAYLERGLGELPANCKDATDEYQDANNDLGLFKKDCLIKENGCKPISASELRIRYVKWCADTQHDIRLEDKYFTRDLQECGLSRKRTNTGIVYPGWRAKTNNDGPKPVEAVPVHDRFISYDGRRYEVEDEAYL